MEIVLDYQQKRNKPVYKNPALPLVNGVKNNFLKEKREEVKPVTVKEQTRNSLIDQRRALGLCFKCAEKYYPGHQCKVKVHMMVAQEEEEDEEEQQELDGEDSIDNVVVSMCVISSNSQLSTMRFKGKLGTREICALFDSGSTHSFVNPNALQGVKCKIVDTVPIVVMVAEGTKGSH
jgi:hypothetical protein